MNGRGGRNLPGLFRTGPWLALQPGEWRRLLCLLLLSLFQGVFASFFLATALALFLESFRVTRMPIAYIASSIVGFAAVNGFTRLGRRIPFARLTVLTMLTLAAGVCALRWLSLAVNSRWAGFGLVVCVAPAVTLLDLAFWGLAARLLDLRRRKQLLGLVSTGEVLASIAGFFLVPCLPPRFRHADHLLIPAAAGLALAAAVAILIGHLYRGDLGAPASAPDSGFRTPPRPLFRSPYAVLMALSTALFIATFHLADFAFLSEVQAWLTPTHRTAVFLGIFFGTAKTFELLIKTFLSGRLLHQVGLRPGLAALPLALLGCALLTVAAGSLLGTEGTAFFSLIILAKLAWVTLSPSLFEPSSRVLYQPLAAGHQHAVQGVLEGGVRQATVFAVGVALALFAALGGGTLSLAWALLPLLAAWTAVVVLLYRGYRARLLGALETHPPAASVADHTAEELRAVLFGLPPGRLPEALELVALAAPEAMAPILRLMMCTGSPRARAAGLAHAARNAFLDTLPHGDALAPLLWDNNREIRCAALIVAGRSQNAAFVRRILDHLSTPGLSGVAAFAAASLGETALPHLEQAFNRAAAPAVQRSILRICQAVGSPGAHRILLDKLLFPDRAVQIQATRCLAEAGFRAAPGQEENVKRTIATVVELAAWDLAAGIDLLGASAARATRRCLALELAGKRRFLFRLLSLLYDPRAIDLARRRLAGDAPGAVYALEILHVLIDADLKPLVLPLVEGLPPAVSLSRLEDFAPQPHLPPVERLRAVIHREHAAVGTWTKATAITETGELASGTVPDDLIACLHHPDLLLREVAALAIHRICPRECERLARRLPAAEKAGLDAVTGSAGGHSRHLSRFERAQLFLACPSFASLSRELLIDLSRWSGEQHLSPGEPLSHLPAPAGTLCAVAEGRLAGASGGESVAPREAFLIAPGCRYRAEEPTRLLWVDADRLRDLAAEQPRLLRALLPLCGETSAPASEDESETILSLLAAGDPDFAALAAAS